MTPRQVSVACPATCGTCFEGGQITIAFPDMGAASFSANEKANLISSMRAAIGAATGASVAPGDLKSVLDRTGDGIVITVFVNQEGIVDAFNAAATKQRVEVDVRIDGADLTADLGMQNGKTVGVIRPATTTTSTSTSSSPCANHSRPVDVVFVFDESSSINNPDVGGKLGNFRQVRTLHITPTRLQWARSSDCTAFGVDTCAFLWIFCIGFAHSHTNCRLLQMKFYATSLIAYFGSEILAGKLRVAVVGFFDEAESKYVCCRKPFSTTLRASIATHKEVGGWGGWALVQGRTVCGC